MPDVQPVVTTSDDGQYWIAHWNGHTYATRLQHGGWYVDGQMTHDGEACWVGSKDGMRTLIRKCYSR